jgi:hypothetical protein
MMYPMVPTIGSMKRASQRRHTATKKNMGEVLNEFCWQLKNLLKTDQSSTSNKSEGYLKQLSRRQRRHENCPDMPIIGGQFGRIIRCKA